MSGDPNFGVQRSTFSVQRSDLVGSAVVDSDNPWLGLASFTEESRAYFHGRDEEIAELSRRVQRKLLTILFGQSGLGKTSILRAGVVPRLRNEGYVPVYVRIDYSSGAPAPSAQVWQAIENALAGSDERQRVGAPENPLAGARGYEVAGAESLWEFFHHRDKPWIDRANRSVIPLIIFDQFEEIFTLAQSDDAGRQCAADFIDDLADLVENRAPQALEAKLETDDSIVERFDFTRSDYRILISLREDYLPHLESLKARMPSVTQNRVRLAPMTGAQALDAVIKPGGALVTPEVARAIVEFVAGARGGSVERLAELQVEPPLLSVICRELNERRRALGQAQITAEMVTGNRREILTDFYERSVGDLPEPIRRFVEDKLLTKSGFRDNLSLETALEEPGVTRPLIDTLVSRRLLRIEDRLGSQRVELTHDVLADVVRASRDARQQQLLLEKAQERERLALAAAAKRTHRMRLAIIGLTLAVVGLSIGAVFGIRAQNKARRQASQNDLLLGSRLIDEGKISEGLAHLVRSARKERQNDVVASRLLSILASQNFAFPVGAPLPLASPAHAALYSPDGRRIVCLGQDGVVRVIDTDLWRVAGEWKFDEPVETRVGFTGGMAGRFSIRADDRFEVFAVKLRSGAMIVCDAAGKPRGAAIRPPDGKPIVDFALSPDGRWLGATDDVSLWLWDANSGELRATLPHNGLFRFSPDSRKVATLVRGGAGQSKVFSVPDGAPVGSPIAYLYGSSQGRFFSSDSARLFINHAAGVQAYDIESGKPVGPLLRNLVRGDYASTLSPDGKRLVLTGQRAVVLDVDTGAMVFPPFEHGGRIREAGFSRDGRTLFTNSIDGLFRLWDLETGRLLGSPMHRQEEFTPAALSPDGRQVAVFASAGPVTRMQFRRQTAVALDLPRPGARNSNFLTGTPPSVIWFKATEAQVIEIATGRTAERFPLPVPATFRSAYGGTAEPGDAYFGFSAGTGISAVIMGERGPARTVTLENTATLDAVGYVIPGRNHVGRVSGNTLTIWELKSGRQLRVISSGLAMRVSIRGQPYHLTADDSRIAVPTVDGTLHVWDVASGGERFTVRSAGRAEIQSFRLLADGRLLTGDGEGGLQVWTENGRPQQEIRAHRGAILRFDVSRDERYFATLSEDATVQVWERATLRRVSTMPIDAVSRVEFSWDGSRLIAPWRAGARVWDVRTGQPVTEGLEHEGMATNLYGPHEQFVSTLTSATGSDASQRLWAVPPSAPGRTAPDWLLTLATAAAGQRLTDDGELVAATEEMARLEELRRTIVALPASDPFAEWAQWIVSDDPNRPIAPGFKITPAEAKALRDELMTANTAVAGAPGDPP